MLLIHALYSTNTGTISVNRCRRNPPPESGASSLGKCSRPETFSGAGTDGNCWEQDRDYRRDGQTPPSGTSTEDDGELCYGATQCHHEAPHAPSSEWPVASSFVRYSKGQRLLLCSWLGSRCAHGGSAHGEVVDTHTLAPLMVGSRYAYGGSAHG
ncbi:hypothetical protein AVEN_17926-1 [Araneus ventricosus]|uniref:Uncharacterized protein n=1 Tax=Araneus ventricosus TaxID=182803 RepID=A0A4Y2FZK3_ARAVE|nr:hypothetical protein AVEN_17926-1 [Araneus ventricosus]